MTCNPEFFQSIGGEARANTNVLSDATSPRAPQVFSYLTTDTYATIDVVGYFNPVRQFLQVGDTIDVTVINSSNALQSSSFYKVTSKSLSSVDVTNTSPGSVQVPSSNASAPNIEANTSINYIDPNTLASTIAGGGQSGFPNKIGLAFSGESGTYGSNVASYAIIAGAYDNLNNQIAGTISGGAHHKLDCGYTNISGNHGTIGGGSTNRIKDGAYCTIAGGGGAVSPNLIDGDATNHPDGAVIGGGRSNTLNKSADAVLAGGSTNVITATGVGQVISGGYNNSIVTTTGVDNVVSGGHNNNITGAASSYNFIVGGDGNTISSTGNYNGITGGLNNTISGSGTYSLVHGSTHTMTQNACLAFGQETKAVAPGSLTFSGRKITSVGDCQNVMVGFGVQTTDATLTNMVVTAGGSFIEFDDAKTTVFTGRVFLQGVRPSDGVMSSYQLDFSARWTGSVETILDAGGSGTTRSLTAITNGLALGTAPILALNTGSFRPKVTGLVGTNITWTAFVMGTMHYF